MLFGVRRDLQLGLVQDGYAMRVYLPYGEEWYAYLVRRLASDRRISPFSRGRCCGSPGGTGGANGRP